MATDGNQLLRTYIAEKECVTVKGIKRIDGRVDVDASAEALQNRRKRIGDRLRAAASHRPSHSVRCSGQQYSGGGTERSIQRQKGMRGYTREKRAGSQTFKYKRRQKICWQTGRDSEASEQKRMPRKVQDGLKHFFG